MKSAAPQFIDIYKKCQYEDEHNDGMQIGSLLTIISDSLVEQLENRHYFSVNATLTQNNIILFQNYMDESTNILNVNVCLHERVVRFILGDNNLYNSMLSGIKRERSEVRLAQVVLPDVLKEEIEGRVGSYLQSREDGSMNELDKFFGYGTAFALLFHGPSGTGKTMLAQGIANRFDKEIISLNFADTSERHISINDLLEAIFHEASSHGSIVFLDECDDLFENNSRTSRALLIEIEKARCIVILATNKPVDLDPAMDRRIAMKVAFALPEKELRLKIWKSLIPETVTLAPDIDLEKFADRYHFSGGLIKNSVFMALAYSRTNILAQPSITLDQLEKAADLQTASLSDLNRICTYSKPVTLIDELPLGLKQRDELNNIAKAWNWLSNQGLGLNLLFNCNDIDTGVLAISGIAAASGMMLRVFDYAQLSSYSSDDKIIDPVTQRKVLPIVAAFSAVASDRSLTLFVDYSGDITKRIDADDDKLADYTFLDMLAQLRQQTGLFCLITKDLKSSNYPVEFHQVVNLSYPPDDLQISCWEEQLGKDIIFKEALTRIVGQYPMHVKEIKFIARQATVKAIMKNGRPEPDMQCILEAVSGYRKKVSTPILFGG